MNFANFLKDVRLWSNHNFGENDGIEGSLNPLLGVMEELGELVHCILKTRQKIRLDENHTENGKDAVGDLMIYLVDFCSRIGWSLEECIEKAWDEVKDRDWVKYPNSGGKPPKHDAELGF